MKKIMITSIVLASILGLNAEKYLIILDDKHYVDRVAVNEYQIPINDEEDNTIYESPYTTHDLFSVDWKIENDGKVFVDSITGIEWLSVSETSGITLNDMDNLLNTTYAGWRYPTVAEVEHLISYVDHSGWNSDNWQYATDTSQAVDFKNKIGGQYGSYRISPTTATFAGVWGNGSYVYFNRLTFSTGDVVSYLSVNAGVFLVSDGGLTLSSQNNPGINTPVVLN